MKRKILLLWFFTIINSSLLLSQESFNVMFYNLLNFPLEDAVPNRIQYLNTILNDYLPDVFMVCELNNDNGANDILNSLRTSVSSDFEMATFVQNTSDDNIGDQNDLQNLIYYNSSKFILESQSIVTTIFRDFNHYELKINTVNQDTNPIVIDFIVCHLKASDGSENEASRLEMVEDLTAYLNTFPSDSNVVLGGDLNLYTYSEDAFQELTDTTNNIVFVDPANQIGSWHNNTLFIDVFTQSTRTQSGMGGTTGGFDDRFDFILCSDNLIDNSNIYYAPNSYQVFGNNGNIDCFNNAIIDPECSGTEFSFEIRDALHNFSDHLPVTLQIETTETLLNVEENTIQSNFEIVGTNIVQNSITISLVDQSNFIKKLKIYNALGQCVKTIARGTSDYDTVDVSGLADGLYYIKPVYAQVEPLKFVKTH
ncbi:hypothetical protein C1T31_10715 [Hanstruepera neustonica]|uniref:Endonuclease/exonuclease/phosphatase domain-containing protein n=1 Tax=Hanstruepera neustonica TaxID=1445657 RepID=A0A2K1DX51_9FLAO|nr:endonuclease/exonuclease/phosphatase family protein [Hanstruepera neustonica]PNQ72614.1 hypothetical protein C1T31_10715 [Hanstruepera neustonica]